MRAALPSLPAMMFVLVAGGCAPIVNIEGSFFPAWLLCLLLGLVVTAVVRPVLARSGLEPHLGPLLLVYPCLCLFLTFSIWLVFYRS